MQDNVSTRLSKAVGRPSADKDHGPQVPSKTTLEEVRKLLKRYTEEVSSSVELSQTSKTMYIDFADCFVRWMYGGFQPGARGSRPRKRGST
jgi:hypothetical protein